MYVRYNVMFVELNTDSDSYARTASTRVLDNGVNDLDNKQVTTCWQIIGPSQTEW